MEHLPYSLQDYPEVCPIHHFKGDSKYKDEEGVYTYKTHHAGNRMPWWLVTLFHKDMLVMHEETWNSHPFFHQTFTLPELFASKFSTTVKSIVVATEPKGEQEMEENIFGLSPEDLERRQMSSGHCPPSTLQTRCLRKRDLVERALTTSSQGRQGGGRSRRVGRTPTPSL